MWVIAVLRGWLFLWPFLPVPNDRFGSKAVSRDYLSDLSLVFEDPRLF